MTEQPVDALAALGGESLPLATADVGSSGSTPAPPPGDPRQVDDHGVTFDRTKHEADANGNGKRRRDGGWVLKRGNGARKSKGLGLLNLFRGGQPAEQPAPASATDAPTPAPTTGASFLASPGPAPAGGAQPGGAAAQPEAAPNPIESYDATAAALTHGQFAVLTIALGPAWEAQPQEHKAWVDMWRRLWFHYQLPVVGPLIEFLILSATTIAKRRGDAETKRRVGGLWRWLRGGNLKEAQDVEVRS